MFAKAASPLSTSSFNLSTSGNPYASYFGSQQHHNHHHQPQPSMSGMSPPSMSTSQGGLYYGGGGGGLSSMTSPNQSGFMSPPGAACFNQSLGSGASAPFLNASQQYGVGSGNAGSGQGQGQGGSTGTSHFTPPQTKIIGGIHSPSSIIRGISGTSNNSSFPHQQHQSPSSNTSPPRYYGSPLYGHGQSPTRAEISAASEPMHYSPIQGGSSSSPYGPGSYSSLGLYGISPANSVVLPSYLLGLDQPHHHHLSFQSATGLVNVSSPTGVASSRSSLKSSRLIEPSSFLNPATAGSKKTVMFDTSNLEGNRRKKAGESLLEGGGDIGDVDGNVVKHKGPPKHGFGSMEGSTTKEFLDSPLMKDSYCPKYVESPVAPSVGCGDRSSPAAAAVQGNTSTWITVFGFPNGASSFILTQFSTCGKIVEVKSTPGSNWLHIRYSNKIEARRALTKNGKVVGGSIMVGVMNSDPKVVQDAEQTNNEGVSSTRAGNTPTSSSSVLKERNSLDFGSDSIKSRIRPLATGSMANPCLSSPVIIKTFSPMPSISRESLEVEKDPSGSQSLPSASTGVFTKAMEFMFGW